MLSIQSIVKQYEQHRALNNVSMEIPEGSVFGLLGPNGAGKTSLIRIINQITAPDEGQVLFKGELLKPEHINRIGYLPEERGLYKKMEIGEQILYLSQLKGLSRAEATKRVKYWFEKLEIQSWWHKKVEELSKGMQQKIQFVATILHEPELLILDEPFSGFDPINAEIIKNEFLELNKKGTTIIFSSHRMESVEELCDYIALLNKSEKILEGKVSDIRKQYSNNIFDIKHQGQFPSNENSSNDFEIINSMVQTDGSYLTSIKLKPELRLNNVIKNLLNHIELEGVQEKIPSINDIFIENVKNA